MSDGSDSRVERVPLRECVVLGNRVAYYERGAGTTLVLVHGLFGDHMDWAPVLEPLAAKYRVIALDLPGFGDSDKSARHYTPEFYIDALHAFFSTLDLRKIVLVGNSLGGLLSSLYAAAHPERLQSLVLVSSAGMREYSAWEQRLATDRFSLGNLLALRPEHIEPLFSLNFAQLTSQRVAYLERQRAKLLRTDYASYARVLSECAAFAFARPVVPLLREVRLPILLLWGDRDPVFPPDLARAALPVLLQAELALIAGASHMPQMDQPEDFVRAMERFIQEQKGEWKEEQASKPKIGLDSR